MSVSVGYISVCLVAKNYSVYGQFVVQNTQTGDGARKSVKQNGLYRCAEYCRVECVVASTRVQDPEQRALKTDMACNGRLYKLLRPWNGMLLIFSVTFYANKQKKIELLVV